MRTKWVSFEVGLPAKRTGSWGMMQKDTPAWPFPPDHGDIRGTVTYFQRYSL